MSAKGTLVDELFDLCLQGKVTLSEVLREEWMYHVYVRNVALIDKALAGYSRRRAWLACEKIRRGEIETRVVFITGSKDGRDRCVQQMLADARAQFEHWQVCVDLSCCPPQPYDDQEILLLDGVRAWARSAMDWVMLIDPQPEDVIGRGPRLILVDTFLSDRAKFARVKGGGGAGKTLNQFLDLLALKAEVVHADPGEA